VPGAFRARGRQFSADGQLNPKTTLRFNLSSPGYTTLKIYDLTGQGIAALIDGYMSAGTHYTVYNGSRQSSGIYIARLQHGGKTDTQQLLLLK
jgi:hypothetical protein